MVELSDVDGVVLIGDPVKLGEANGAAPVISETANVIVPVRPATEVTVWIFGILCHVVPLKTTSSPTFHNETPSSDVVPDTETI